MNRITICKYCGKPEYYGEYRWLNSHMFCRSCYKAKYEAIYMRHYRWDDLDGKRPTMKEYEEQKKRR